MSGPTRSALVVGNWKMHLSASDADRLVDGIVAGLREPVPCALGVAPPFPYLERVVARTRGTPLSVGSQDLHWEPRGAFTGAVSAAMVADVGATFTLVGHSERRQHFGETDPDVARKAVAALAVGLDVVVCVGETEGERDAGRTLEVVGRQVRAVIGALPGRVGSRLTVAYEPVWAIGTGRVPTADQIVEVHAAIRGILADAERKGSSSRILYGGSVSPDNAGAILPLPDVDGALVGGASLDAERFLAIAAAAGLPARGPT